MKTNKKLFGAVFLALSLLSLSSVAETTDYSIRYRVPLPDGTENEPTDPNAPAPVFTYYFPAMEMDCPGPSEPLNATWTAENASRIYVTLFEIVNGDAGKDLSTFELPPGTTHFSNMESFRIKICNANKVCVTKEMKRLC